MTLNEQEQICLMFSVIDGHKNYSCNFWSRLMDQVVGNNTVLVVHFRPKVQTFHGQIQV